MAKSSMRWGKWLSILITVAALVGGAVWYFKFRGRETIEYQTVPVSRGEITQVVTATGTLNPVLNVQVGSQISGIIQKLYADFNTPVRSNQVIAQLDSATYRANVSSAEGDLANARAALELAQVEANRAEALRKENLVSPSEYDRTIATLHQAEAQVKMKEASLERARVDLSRCTIYAPVDGIVISRNVDVGQTVAASLSAPILFQIANDLTKMQINAAVAEADVGAVETNQHVEFAVDAFPNRTFHGTVVQVRNAPVTVQSVVTYDAVIEVNNPDMKLKPGMTATVSIVIARRDDVLKIPNAALRFRPPDTAVSTTNTAAAGPRPEGGGRSGGQRGGGGGRDGMARGGRSRGERQMARTVYVLPPQAATDKEIKPKPVQIRTGITDTSMTEVLEGLNDGDQVVVGMVSSEPAATAPSNPFSGGGRPGGFPRRF